MSHQQVPPIESYLDDGDEKTQSNSVSGDTEAVFALLYTYVSIHSNPEHLKLHRVL